ncbi:MAG: tetratricopeptide repeat protein [Candidatus Limnocylindria bacterium]
MKLAFALLADYAIAHDQDRKLYMVGGGIRALRFPALPVTHPRLALAVGLELANDELGVAHLISIEAHGPAGEQIAKPVEMALHVPTTEQPPVYVNFVYNMEGIVFAIEGDYGVTITIDGKRAHEVPLLVGALPGPVPTAVQAAQLLQQGYRTFGAGDVAGAAKIFKEVTERFPQEPGGHNNLGFVLLSVGDAAAALDAFQRARELGYPQDEISDANVASALYLTGDASAAAEMFADCLRTHVFGTPATLFGIGAKGLFPVQLNSAAEYGALMALNAAWSSMRAGDAARATHYLGVARTSELLSREDVGALLAASVNELEGEAEAT